MAEKKSYFKQNDPFIVPTTDGKLIEEHFGNASTGDGSISIARMVAPPGWSEPPQVPEFDEYTLVVRGRKSILLDEGEVVLRSGESIKVSKGCRVQYSNPFDEETEYVSVCIPAFSPELVHREG